MKSGSKKDLRGKQGFLQFRDLALAEMGYDPKDPEMGAMVALADHLGISPTGLSQCLGRCSLMRLFDLLDAWERGGGRRMAAHYVERRLIIEFDEVER